MIRQADGTIYIDTSIDTQGFDKGVKSINKSAEGLTKAFGKLGLAIGSVFAAKELIDFGKSALELGSELQEVQNVVDVTFTTMSDKVDEFAKSAYKTAGLSETMAKQYTGVFGSMAKAFGFTEKEAFTMSTVLTQMTGDLASFKDLSQDEAFSKLKGIFTGETEALSNIGVVMTQAALDSYALEKGLGKTTKQMSEQEKVALRYQFVLDMLVDANGDYVRTLDSWANQTKFLSTYISQLKATIGEGLINLFTPLLQVLNAIIERLTVLAERFKKFTEDIMGIKSTKTTEKAKDEVEQLGENYQDATAGLKEYQTATKKASAETKKSLSPLDNLNNITSDVASNFSDMADGLIGTGGENGATEANEEFEETDDILTRIRKKFKQIFNDLKKTDFSKYGVKLSDFVVLSLDTIIEKIENADWKTIGEKVGEFVGGIDWLEIIKKAFELKFNIWKAIAEVWFGAFEAAPIETAIITSIAALKFSGLGKVLSSAIAGALGGATLIAAITGAFASLGGIGGILTMDMALILGAGSLAEIGLAIGTGIIGGIIAAVGGWSLGQYLYEVFSGEEIDMSWAEQFDAIKESFSDGSWKEALELLGQDIESVFKEIGNDIAEWWDVYVVKPIELALEDIRKSLEELLGYDTPREKRSISNRGGGGGGHLPKISANTSMPILNIPHLAAGTVIPPNAPFMAMLGDQKHGTNIEAPLDTIKQAVAEVMANINPGRDNRDIVIEISGREIFRVIRNEAEEYFETTGNSAFPF